MKPKYSKTNSEESCDSGQGSSTLNSFEDSPKKKYKVEVEQKNEYEIKKDDRMAKSKPNLKNLGASSERNGSKNVKLDDGFEKPSNYNNGYDEKELSKINKENKKIKDEKHVNSTNESSESKKKTSEENAMGLLKTEVVTSPSVNDQKISKDDMLSWADKYKPQDVKSIIGQQEGSSNMNKLKKWLMNWYRNQQPEMRKKIPKPSPWAKNDDGAYYKAALLSGPPGVGKYSFDK